MYLPPTPAFFQLFLFPPHDTALRRCFPQSVADRCLASSGRTRAKRKTVMASSARSSATRSQTTYSARSRPFAFMVPRRLSSMRRTTTMTSRLCTVRRCCVARRPDQPSRSRCAPAPEAAFEVRDAACASSCGPGPVAGKGGRADGRTDSSCCRVCAA